MAIGPSILEQEDTLKGLPTEALQQMMRQPSPNAPPFLVAAELKRREQMAKEFAGKQAEAQMGQNAPTVAHRLAGMQQPMPMSQAGAMAAPPPQAPMPQESQIAMALSGATGQPPPQLPTVNAATGTSGAAVQELVKAMRRGGTRTASQMPGHKGFSSKQPAPAPNDGGLAALIAAILKQQSEPERAYGGFDISEEVKLPRGRGGARAPARAVTAANGTQGRTVYARQGLTPIGTEGSTGTEVMQSWAEDYHHLPLAAYPDTHWDNLVRKELYEIGDRDAQLNEGFSDIEISKALKRFPDAGPPLSLLRRPSYQNGDTRFADVQKRKPIPMEVGSQGRTVYAQTGLSPEDLAIPSRGLGIGERVQQLIEMPKGEPGSSQRALYKMAQNKMLNDYGSAQQVAAALEAQNVWYPSTEPSIEQVAEVPSSPALASANAPRLASLNPALHQSDLPEVGPYSDTIRANLDREGSRLGPRVERPDTVYAQAGSFPSLTDAQAAEAAQLGINPQVFAQRLKSEAERTEAAAAGERFFGGAANRVGSLFASGDSANAAVPKQPPPVARAVDGSGITSIVPNVVPVDGRPVPYAPPQAARAGILAGRASEIVPVVGQPDTRSEARRDFENWWNSEWAQERRMQAFRDLQTQYGSRSSRFSYFVQTPEVRDEAAQRLAKLNELIPTLHTNPEEFAKFQQNPHQYVTTALAAGEHSIDEVQTGQRAALPANVPKAVNVTPSSSPPPPPPKTDPERDALTSWPPVFKRPVDKAEDDQFQRKSAALKGRLTALEGRNIPDVTGQASEFFKTLTEANKQVHSDLETGLKEFRAADTKDFEKLESRFKALDDFHETGKLPERMRKDRITNLMREMAKGLLGHPDLYTAFKAGLEGFQAVDKASRDEYAKGLAARLTASKSIIDSKMAMRNSRRQEAIAMTKFAAEENRGNATLAMEQLKVARQAQQNARAHQINLMRGEARLLQIDATMAGVMKGTETERLLRDLPGQMYAGALAKANDGDRTELDRLYYRDSEGNVHANIPAFISEVNRLKNTGYGAANLAIRFDASKRQFQLDVERSVAALKGEWTKANAHEWAAIAKSIGLTPPSGPIEFGKVRGRLVPAAKRYYAAQIARERRFDTKGMPEWIASTYGTAGTAEGEKPRVPLEALIK